MLTLEHEEEALRHLAFMVSYLAQMNITLKGIDEKLDKLYYKVN